MSKNNSYYLKLISVNLDDKNIICYTKKTIGKRIISLDEFANDKVKALKDEKADIDNILYQRYLHNALTEALDSLPVIERQIIEECFFYNDVKRKTYEELGEKHNLSKGAYYNKLCRFLRKLRTLLEQYSEF